MENIGTTGFSFDLPKGNSSIIKVIGVGGGGNNALKHMYERGIHGVDFVICNTDSQTLDNNPVSNKVQLGVSITEGLGAGADPEVGEKAAIESIEDIKAAMGQNTKMVFITAGMGGGTGTGAAPVIAKVAKDMGILTVGIVTVPFSFEGKRRLEQAELGLDKLRNNVDSLIVINNDKLRQQFGNLGFKSGFSKADEVLTNAAKGMAEVITGYFDVNIDFRDAKSVLQNSGTALMSNGIASGEKKAEEAVKRALDSPLLNDNKITGARNVLLLIRSGSEEVTMDEIGVIMDHIQEEAGNTADIIFGVGTDEELGDSVSVLVIATGFAKDHKKNTGVTEKVKFTLSDSMDGGAKKDGSSFPTEVKKEQVDSGNIFILDDDDDDTDSGFPTAQFTQTNTEKKRSAEHDFPTQTETYDAPRAAETFGQPASGDDFDHFTFGEEEDDDDEEPQSFTFENTYTPAEPQSAPSGSEEEKPVEFNFFVNEKPAASSQQVTTPKAQAETQQMAPEVKEEEVHQTPVSEVSDGFTFINKTPASDKVQERRNKLKEFNSRYQKMDNDNEFETVPAFRRKNISIGQDNPSEQKINNYLADNDGKMEIRENRFLNKDVD